MRRSTHTRRSVSHDLDATATRVLLPHRSGHGRIFCLRQHLGQGLVETRIPPRAEHLFAGKRWTRQRVHVHHQLPGRGTLAAPLIFRYSAITRFSLHSWLCNLSNFFQAVYEEKIAPRSASILRIEVVPHLGPPMYLLPCLPAFWTFRFPLRWQNGHVFPAFPAHLSPVS